MYNTTPLIHDVTFVMMSDSTNVDATRQVALAARQNVNAHVCSSNVNFGPFSPKSTGAVWRAILITSVHDHN